MRNVFCETRWYNLPRTEQAATGFLFLLVMPGVFKIYLLLVFLFGTHFCSAQKCKTAAKAITTKAALQEVIKNNPDKKLVALKRLMPNLITDLRYATTNNFTHTILYTHPVPYLHIAPAYALKQVDEELRKKGLAIKLYDAFRPFDVTCKIWRLVPDRRYAANPKKASNHNRALAVDLTIIDLKTNKELDMGTPFDSFTDTAHHSFTLLPANILANRRLLKAVMRKYGFGMVPDEWWHYQWPNNNDYEIIDLDFDDLKGIAE